MAKRIEKDHGKSNIQSHQCKGFGLGFSDLIPSTYICKHKPNARDTRAAPKNKEHIATFDKKFEN